MLRKPRARPWDALLVFLRRASGRRLNRPRPCRASCRPGRLRRRSDRAGRGRSRLKTRPRFWFFSRHLIAPWLRPRPRSSSPFVGSGAPGRSNASPHTSRQPVDGAALFRLGAIPEGRWPRRLRRRPATATNAAASQAPVPSFGRNRRFMPRRWTRAGFGAPRHSGRFRLPSAGGPPVSASFPFSPFP